MTTADTTNKARLPRDERRALLLSAALEVFTAAGYHSAAMDEIADRANVSKPVLYQHFPSKLDLYLAVLDLHIDSLVFEIQKAIASTPDNANRVHATVDAYFAFIEKEGEAFRLLFESDMSVEPAVRERLNRMTYDCAAAASAVISIDTGLPREAYHVFAISTRALAKRAGRPSVSGRSRACNSFAQISRLNSSPASPSPLSQRATNEAMT